MSAKVDLVDPIETWSTLSSDMPELHTHIDGRAGFFRVLDETIAMNDALRMGFGATLEKIKAWTANGRAPTADERASVEMTGGLAKNYDSMPAELQAFADRISEIQFYFEWWPSDEEWNDEAANDRRLVR